MAREEFKAGLFTIAALGILSVFVVLISGYSPWKKTVAYRTRFPQVVGFSPGTPVKLNGVLVGQVEQIRLLDEEAQVEVLFGLEAGRRLRAGVYAEMAMQGLIGDTFLLLTQEKGGGETLAPGSLIPSITKLDMAQTMNAVGRLAAKAEVRLDSMADRIETILTSLQEVVNPDKMTALAHDLEAWKEDIGAILGEGRKLTAEVETTARKAGVLVDDLQGVVKEVKGAVGEDQELLREALTEFNARFKTLGPRVERMIGVIETAVTDSQAKLGSILGQGENVVKRTSMAADLTLEEVVRVAHNLAQASRNLISLTERLQDDPSLILRGPK
jgi:ABC-type transporter Mla subunit MlaD